MVMSHKTGKRGMTRRPKILIHEHIDCSPRHRRLLTGWERFNFDPSKVKFPEATMAFWKSIGFDPASVAFPKDVVELWTGKRLDASLTGTARAAQFRKDRNAAVKQYEQFLRGYASSSLANYVNAIVVHILPLMQTADDLYVITKERIEDAVKDGIVGLELRFAPQLHTWNGLSMDDVMQAVIKAVKESPIPCKLILCALRHEDESMAEKVAGLAIKYKRYVGVFDLAADEHANPGVLKSWINAARRVQAAGILLTIHLWETDEPTDADIELLNLLDIQRLGHGFRGNRQGHRVLECCPKSNEVTGQVASYGEHPIDDLYNQGKNVTVNTDGTTLTGITGLTDEYLLLQEHFGWDDSHFLKVNLTALEASSFSRRVKAHLRKVLKAGYSK